MKSSGGWPDGLQRKLDGPDAPGGTRVSDERGVMSSRADREPRLPALIRQPGDVESQPKMTEVELPKLYLVATFKAPVAVVSGKMSGKMSGKILAILAERPEATIPELAREIGVVARTIERGLKVLQKQDRLKRIGPAKGGRWEVLRSGS